MFEAQRQGRLSFYMVCILLLYPRLAVQVANFVNRSRLAKRESLSGLQAR